MRCLARLATVKLHRARLIRSVTNMNTISILAARMQHYCGVTAARGGSSTCVAAFKASLVA